MQTTCFGEPVVGPPASKSACKNGGWKSFTSPTFKKQGQCVADVNHHNGKGDDDSNAASPHHKSGKHNR